MVWKFHDHILHGKSSGWTGRDNLTNNGNMNISERISRSVRGVQRMTLLSLQTTKSYGAKIRGVYLKIGFLVNHVGAQSSARVCAGPTTCLPQRWPLSLRRPRAVLCLSSFETKITFLIGLQEKILFGFAIVWPRAITATMQHRVTSGT